MNTQISVPPALRMLSHSSCSLLHSCPRKYELTKLSPPAPKELSCHLVFGSAFGAGVQEYLISQSLQDAFIKAALNWKAPLDYEELDKEDKSFWNCLEGIKKFSFLVNQNRLLQDYEIVYYKDAPASELGFTIHILDVDTNESYYYRGYLDLLLKHKITNKYLVVDVKTTRGNYIDTAKYINSGQVLGYSIIIDAVAEGQQDFEVLYLEYMTRKKTFSEYPYPVLGFNKAKWLKNLFVDVQTLKHYEFWVGDEGYPMNGNHCSAYGRQCQFLNTCQLTNSTLGIRTELKTMEDLQLEEADKNYAVNVEFSDLITTQLEAHTGL